MKLTFVDIEDSDEDSSDEEEEGARGDKEKKSLDESEDTCL